MYRQYRFPLNAQEDRFMALQGGQVLDRAVRASERVIRRGDIAPDPTETSPPLSEGTTQVESSPGMELQSQVEYRSDDPKGRAKTSTAFLSSLSDSFRAATASFRAKPEPIATAMCQSAKSGNVKHIRGLIAQGANVNGKDEEGYTPLIYAVRANQLDAVQILIHAGADLTMKDSQSGKGMPPLLHAAECGHVSMAETLMNSGADPNASDIMGKSLIAMIINNTTTDNTTQPEIARMAFQRGCNPNQSDSWGEPLLSHVMIKGNIYLLQAFLEYGADPNKRIKRQETPLLYALDHGRLDQFRMILKYGADPNKADAQGRTPLLEVLQMDTPDLVQELLTAGANVNQLGQVRPLSLARLVGSQETVRMLVSWGAEAPSRPSLATHEDQATGVDDNQRFSSAEDDMLPAYM
ncbi:hypothetical protein EIK77_005871 [Talaromyces pinophilus]|nr:hypothetical protein EIK77_005871 [Talaromyces pinophilus]